MKKKTRGKVSQKSTAARPTAGAGLVDTFKLNPKLTRRLHEAAALMTASPEWFIQEALVSLIDSTHEDGTVRSDCQDSYRDDVRRKAKCSVQPVKGGAR